jgi:flagellar FliJ protein
VKRFHFRLERLLEIRAYRERRWLAKLAEAAGHCIRLAREIEHNREAARGAFHTRVREGEKLDLALLSYRELYLNRLSREKRELNGELEKRIEQRDKVQQEYKKVSRDKKVLEKLKETREKQHYADSRREEFKVLDDLNSSRFGRDR